MERWLSSRESLALRRLLEADFTCLVREELESWIRAVSTPTELPSFTQRAATVPLALAVMVCSYWQVKWAEPMALTPLMEAVPDMAVFRVPGFGTAMTTERTARLPLERLSAPEMDWMVPVVDSKVPSMVTSTLWPTE